MKYDRTWGTYVELQAAASLLKLPIYVFTQKSGSDGYYWDIFNTLHYITGRGYNIIFLQSVSSEMWSRFLIVNIIDNNY